jgi:hypothetical protein
LTSRFARFAPTLILAALTLSATLAAAGSGPRPGLWKVTTRVSHEGTTSEPNSQTNCVTAEQMKDPSKSLMPPDTADEKCTRTQYQWTGTILNWRMQCSGKIAMSGGGDITFDNPDHYRGKIATTGSVNGHEFTSTIMLEGERVGECP